MSAPPGKGRCHYRVSCPYRVAAYRAHYDRAHGSYSGCAQNKRISNGLNAQSKTLPEVVARWSVGGGVDYVLKVMTRDIDAYQRLVDDLLQREIGIDRYFTYIVTKTVKDDAVLPVAELLTDADNS